MSEIQQIYVVEFDTGIVKVGRSAKADRRLKTISREARQHGGGIARSWASEEHANAPANERALLEFCAGRGLRVTDGRNGEYFKGLDYPAVVAFAQTLEFDYPTPVVPEYKHCDLPECDDWIDRHPLRAASLISEVIHGSLWLFDPATMTFVDPTAKAEVTP